MEHRTEADRARLRAQLTADQAKHIDECAIMGREVDLLDAQYRWESFRCRGEVWTPEMEDYWQCVIDLHYQRAERRVIDRSANMTNSGLGGSLCDMLAARGD